jgi:hypothetical protein
MNDILDFEEKIITTKLPQMGISIFYLSNYIKFRNILYHY